MLIDLSEENIAFLLMNGKISINDIRKAKNCCSEEIKYKHYARCKLFDATVIEITISGIDTEKIKFPYFTTNHKELVFVKYKHRRPEIIDDTMYWDFYLD